MSFPRATGILLHPSSLPSRGGIGDFGPAAYEFVDFLAAGWQGLWQVLPLGPPAIGNSPYSSVSAFAGNPLFISLERLAEHGWLDPSSLGSFNGSAESVEYEDVQAYKIPLLSTAAQRLLSHAGGNGRARYEKFCADNDWWLEDYALFDALRTRYQKKAWNEWPSDLARRQPAALQEARIELAAEIEACRAIQFFFYEQWFSLRQACAQKGIRAVGDIAIFVAYDSADVWANRHLFRLRESLEPEVVSGVPPDAFSATGQRWGNPLYDWEAMRSDGYEWWIRRMRWATQIFDYVRLDHFRGFDSFWEIPADEPTAINGRWVDGPKDEFFNRLREALGGLPFFAEDLGYITPAVHALRDRQKIPRLAVLQFAFSDPGAHIYLPHRLNTDCVVYTGTHDNNTTVGWWTSAPEYDRHALETYVGPYPDGVNWALIRLAQASVADLSVIPLQDVLGLGGEARLNTPSVPGGNYLWRYRADALTPELSERLARLAEVTDRVPQALPTPRAENFVA